MEEYEEDNDEEEATVEDKEDTPTPAEEVAEDAVGSTNIVVPLEEELFDAEKFGTRETEN